MNRWKLKFGLIAIVIAAPYVLTWGAGCLWFYQQGFLLPILAVTAALTVSGLFLARWLVVRLRKPTDTPLPANNWPASGAAAWRAIDALAFQVEEDPPPLDDLNRLLRLFCEVFETVAPHFHPNSDQPALEVLLPDALLIAERVAHDLRQDISQRGLASHAFTINDLRRLPNGIAFASSLYAYFRLLIFSFNPIAGVVRELSARSAGNLLNLSRAELHRWASGFCVRQAGMYAIQLYSGQALSSDLRFVAWEAEQPLRIVILGQTKAGKSSLVNALFGETKAATDSLPCTDKITPYIFKREGLPKIIIFDTVGFGGANDRNAQRQLDDELGRCDLVIVVCSARSAARQADRQLLDDLSAHFSLELRRNKPPVVVALSHIDCIKPAGEWKPPYNLLVAESVKARNIVEAVDAVANDLGLPHESVVPVCLRNGAVYNVAEGLLPLIMEWLPAAQRSKLLRSMGDFRSAEQLSQLRQQAINLGLVLAPVAVEVVRHAKQLLTGRQPPREVS